MLHQTALRRVLAAVVLSACLSLASPLLSQQAGRPRVPVLVVSVDQLPNTDTPYLILRRQDETPQDIILLRTDATAEQFSEAVHALVTVRQRQGDAASNSSTMRLRPRQQTRLRPRNALPRAPRVLADLRRAEPRMVRGVGTVPAVEIWHPRQSGQRSRP